MAKIDTTKTPTPEALSPAEEAVLEKKKQDEEIKKKLNDRNFLNFLRKNPDAAANSTNDAYILGKIELYEKISKVKKDVQEFIVRESSADYRGVADSSFVESLEGLALSNELAFLDFAGKVSEYLKSDDRNKSLIATYQRVVRELKGETYDVDRMSATEKTKFVEDLHYTLEASKLKHKTDIEDAKSFSNRSLLSYVKGFKANKEVKKTVAEINGKLAKLKTGEQKLDKAAVLASIDEVEAIRSGLQGNQILEVVRGEFKKKANERIKKAITAKDFGSLSKDQASLKDMDNKGSLFDDPTFDDLQRQISDISKEGLLTDIDKLVDSKESVTLNVYEKEIESMRKKGLSLGLTEEECKKEIVDALKIKIDQLAAKPDEGDNTIKLILARRILNNLEQ